MPSPPGTAGCRYPGCADGVDGLHAHHVERWETGGSTDTDHAVLLSPHCHTIVHRPGWSERLEPDGTYVVTTPRGDELRGPPPVTGPPRLPLHTSAEPSRPLPFDPTPSRPTDLSAVAPPDARSEADACVDRVLALVGAAAGPRPCRPAANRPAPADFVIDGWIVSLS